MRKLLLTIALFYVFAIAVIAGEVKDDSVPPGMEIIVINKVRYIVPKGTKVKTVGGVTTLEGRNEHIIGRFETMDIRIRTLEANEKKNRSDIELLKETVEELQAQYQSMQPNADNFIEVSN